MSIKKKILIASLCILAIVGIYVYNDFTRPIVFVDNIQVKATMDLQIYLSDTIVLAKVNSDNESKLITYKAKTQNGEKKYEKLVTDTQLEIKEVYKGNIA